MNKYEPILLKNMMQPGYTGSLADYERAGGYQALRKALGKIAPADIIEVVKKSGLRGRGGAGFPTGGEWALFPQDHHGPPLPVFHRHAESPRPILERPLTEGRPPPTITRLIL